MARPLKVFGLTTTLAGVESHRQVSAIVAATSQKAAADAFDTSLNHLRTYGSVTANSESIEAATAAPGRVFWCPLDEWVDGRRRWRPWEGQDAATERRAQAKISAAKMAEAVAARSEQRKAEQVRRSENSRAAADWAARIRDEFGIDAQPANNGAVDVAIPAEPFYAQLVRIARELEAVGLTMNDVIDPL